jgi:tetratricopeptide (TPR) repeat protein
MGALVLGLALACYWPALRGGPVWDDDAHITKPELRSAAALWQIWSNPHATQQYYPLLHSTFWIEHRIWGDSVVGYHLANVLMHAAAACLLILILQRLNTPGGWLAGLLFVVHPVCVESVAWISEQKNTLSLVFYLLAGMAYVRFDEDRRRPSAIPMYALALLLFVMALLTKSVTATLPAALLVVAWWQRGRLSWRRDVLPLAPWFSLAIASGLLTAWVERKIIGAEGAAYDLTLAQRCLLASRALWFYLGKLFWPSRLVFVYPHWDPRSQSTGWALYLAAALLVTLGLWLLRRRTRGPLAAWLFFVGSLFPALGFFNVFPFIFSYVADHFQYLASIGIFTATASGVVLVLERASPAARGVGLGLVGVFVATLAFLSNRQSGTYADATTLYKATIELNPDCWMAHNNLGVIYSDRGDLVGAVAEYKEVIRLKADFAEAQDNLGGALLKIPDGLNEAVAHLNLGTALERIPGRINEAIAEFEQALRLNPDYPQAHLNMGTALERIPGRINEAVAQYEQALRLQPESAEAHYSLGSALGRIPGQQGAAIFQYHEALRLNPGYAKAHNNLGTVLEKMPGKLNEAVSQFEQALLLEPAFAEAHYNLGCALGEIPGKLQGAISEYRDALRLKPDYAKAHNNLATALARSPGQLDEAISQFREALLLEPDFAEAHFNLGNALAKEPGGFNEAACQYEEALRLSPDNLAFHFNLAMTLMQIPGRSAEAATHLRAVLRIQPNNDRARQFLSTLAPQGP